MVAFSLVSAHTLRDGSGDQTSHSHMMRLAWRLNPTQLQCATNQIKLDGYIQQSKAR
jgi:hypothetical protein